MSLAGDDVIGTVSWPDGGPVGTLHADGTWSVPGHEWQEPLLKALFSDSYRGPADGPFGPGTLAEVAAAVGGRYDVIGRPAVPGAGVVY